MQFPVSPLAYAILSHLNVQDPSDKALLKRLLGPHLLRQVLANGPSASSPGLAAALDSVPELPASAGLTTDQMREAGTVGHWLDDYVAWAGASANETPVIFHEGAALCLAAMAVGRRLYIHTPWRQPVFPNLYVMLVALSTYYRKSAGLSLAYELARAAIPHLVLPQPGSPENFLNMLGGVLPQNFEELPASDRERLLKGNAFAAQRGILRDELSALFKAMSRDYMAGMKELIMQLHDCPPYLDTNTNNRGMVVVRDTALSILGAATPAELASALTVNDWYNGNLARFALLTPEPDYTERPTPEAEVDPAPLIFRLRALHERLPKPPTTSATDGSLQAEAWSLIASIWPHCHAYEQALRSMTAPDGVLEDRLRAVYGRLHVQALKIAILLAAMDWADEGGEGRPAVHPAHWFRAQQIAETWRASAHRLLRDIGESEESRLETRIVKLLRAQPNGLSTRSIYRALKSARKPVIDALAALEQDGTIQKLTPLGQETRTGPHPVNYQLASASFSEMTG
ncbi:MAG: DUF3987 domain-containing protein [Anaerolineae bacterium]|nr:DUF3987 domain-containing protein [Anaerolineae bacterium]